MYLSTLLIDVGDDPDRIRPGRNWLRNRYRVHQRLCMAFPAPERKTRDPHFVRPYDPEDFGRQVRVPRSEEQGFLFRIDPRPGACPVILVQSAVEPDWEYAFHNAKYLLAAPPEVREWNPAFQAGQKFRFRLLANATRKVGTLTAAQRRADPGQVIREPKEDPAGPWRRDRRSKNGARVPVPREQLPGWLARRAGEAGFRLVPDPEAVEVQVEYVYVNRSGFDPEDQDGPDRGAFIPQMFCARFEGLLEVTEPDRFAMALGRGIGPAKSFGCGLLSVTAP
ncbi:MAG TPA: type I-E CRISPR-associated protein Cas6/Cse3/CasE [Candidatus Hydrogenedentes bacterium]|nr:type I-E CRISPR-associated protein Cas6/Cse3/CasE [Candidatus Hydrogenedentota bacterium]HPU98253.1 type I-E CRISPR-associated protein Cas6/Cse3/CasE [Candidatus Hydrogenedentota bacterium]